MKKAIALFICLCTGLTLKPYAKSEDRAFGFEVYKLSSDNEIHYEIQYLTWLIGQLNHRNEETLKSEYYKDSSLFTSCPPLSVISLSQLIEKLLPLEKLRRFVYRRNEHEITNKKASLKELQRSLQYYDGNKQIKKLEAKQGILHEQRCSESNCTCTEISKIIDELRQFHAKSGYRETLVTYLDSAEKIVHDEKMKQDKLKIKQLFSFKSFKDYNYNFDCNFDANDSDDEEQLKTLKNIAESLSTIKEKLNTLYTIEENLKKLNSNVVDDDDENFCKFNLQTMLYEIKTSVESLDSK